MFNPLIQARFQKARAAGWQQQPAEPKSFYSQRATGTRPTSLANSRRFFSASASTPSASSPFLQSYAQHVNERMQEADGQGIAPKPLDASQASALIEELKSMDDGDDVAQELLDLLVHRVPPGVDEAAYVKASWLSALAKGDEQHPLVSRERATELLGTMQGGYNVVTLVARKKMYTTSTAAVS